MTITVEPGHNNEPVLNPSRMCEFRQNRRAIRRSGHIRRTAAAAAAATAVAQHTVKYPHSRQQAEAGATERSVKTTDVDERATRS